MDHTTAWIVMVGMLCIGVATIANGITLWILAHRVYGIPSLRDRVRDARFRRRQAHRSRKVQRLR